MSEYKLAASLEGHEDDVRDVVFPRSDLILSASRDGSVRLWKLLSSSPPQYDNTISSHRSSFINAVAYIPPSPAFSDGLVVSGGKDMIIDVRQPGRPPDQNAERLLTGHAHNICALEISPNGEWIASGSWDGSARVWNVGNWDCKAVLSGHGGSVWSLIAYDNDTIITACADTFIRVFSVTGNLLSTIKGNPEVVRALCRVPRRHPSDADFASASNDGIIRLWKMNGQQVGELRGHTSFVYSLAGLENGDLVSAGEDRTVRIWRDAECIQTITHPAISVWTVAVCPENGDIVTGCSDHIARVFTRSTDRQAAPETIKAFEDAIKSSSIPQQQMGDNKDKLPGPEFLTQKSGTKDGQIAMIKEADGNVTAHSWSSGADQWVRVGTVVDAAGSSGKKQSYLGTDYDCVFDVDIEDGKPPLKLPYNLSQNPYEAATKFIQDNELPISYLDQVANFILTNTQGATIGPFSQASAPLPAGADPWGTESRYRPGEMASLPTQSAPPPPRPKIIPQVQYLSIATANLKTIWKKIGELNQQLLDEGSKHIALNPQELETLNRLTKLLEQSPSALEPSKGVTGGLDVVLKMISTWPEAQRLPALDLLRLLAAATPTLATYNANGGSIIEVLESTGIFADKDRGNNIMLAIRTFANLFMTAEGRNLADSKFDRIHHLATSSSQGTPNRNLSIAVTTLYINYAVLWTSASHASLPSSLDRGLAMMEDLAGMIKRAKDSEEIYRSLVAAGTLLTLGEEVQLAAKEVYGVESSLQAAGRGIKEPRIRNVIAEIRSLLGGS